MYDLFALSLQMKKNYKMQWGKVCEGNVFLHTSLLREQSCNKYLIMLNYTMLTT